MIDTKRHKSEGKLFKKTVFLCVIFLVGFNHLRAQTVVDIDGNVYHTVSIGTQVWMKENLKVTHYRNGDSIIEVRDSLAWVIQKKGAWCNNENKTSNGNIYGKLYNWFAVNDSRQIAPAGWHVPTDSEWKTLEKYIGMDAATANKTNYRGTTEANALKDTGTNTHWTLVCCPGHNPNKGNNSSGFTAWAGGYRIYFNAGGSYTSFQPPTGNAQFWTSTAPNDSTAWLRHLCVYHEDIFRDNWPKVNGSSIRLIKDSAANSILNKKGDWGIEIFPNPASETLFVTSTNNEPLTIQIYNLLGKCEKSIEILNGKNEIDLGTLKKGLYLVKFNHPDGIYVERFIKE